MTDQETLTKLRAENARLAALLDAQGIKWRLPVEPAAADISEAESSRLSTDEKVALFRRLFRGRTDVYPVRWESKSTGRSGYAPACANEWRALQVIEKWWVVLDSNQRPRDYESPALTD